jgi:hypothetical protein
MLSAPVGWPYIVEIKNSSDIHSDLFKFYIVTPIVLLLPTGVNIIRLDNITVQSTALLVSIELKPHENKSVQAQSCSLEHFQCHLNSRYR